ncbi:DUF1707 domain-containing protein [Streptomyces sp. ITFR-6]|uniref:DUF1707 SHOCT-like domain-containing protein n=1 Tax=Streptomyces sp. ITFR-6 TaxID=3075197 RepID=UPI0028898721|nr:DUF1707 domain-containing protein [Streptomyces sp. ITFR-6]WNI34205.1 DUF1707 domain-containing protein [Streptomyces sp. ITFR-6]
MRASDAERERIAEILREAVAEGRLEMEEFEQRLDAAYKARTHGELEPIVRDLPAVGAAVAPVAAGQPRTGSMARWPDRVGKPATSGGAFAFWGGFRRRGNWTVGRKFTAFAMWGGGEIDLREANFEDREVVIRCFAIMGGMQVTVPPDLNVEVRGIGVMGGFGENTKDEGVPAPDSPRVRVTGFALMGGVGVERKRSKAEKQRLREAERSRGRLEKGDGGGGKGK